MISSIAERIMMARRDAEMTQGELAIRAGLSRAMITAIEGGNRTPSMETLQKIATALSCMLEIQFIQRPIAIRDLEDIL